MNCYIQGKGKITLSKQDFIGNGGQGSVYARGNTAYKIYNDTAKMIPIQKIKELSILEKENIIKPIDIILDLQNNIIGYTMKYVTSCFTFCQLFPKIFKDRYNININNIIELVDNFKNTVNYIHKQGILIVDLNELNFLVNNKFNHIYFIDVDSYQTKSYKAMVIMDSIRDRHSTGFNELTDWFSWGIITFQLFTGIHPYKGKHSIYKTLDERMKKNISVFNKEVSIPKLCESFDAIPQKYRDWYYDIFEKGKRTLPPFEKITVISLIKPLIEKIDNSSILLIEKIFNTDASILEYKFINGFNIIKTDKSVYIDNKKYDIENPSNKKIIISPKLNQIIIAWIENEKLKLLNLTKKELIQLNIICHDILEYKNDIYVKNSGNIFKINLIENTKNIMASAVTVANVMEKSAYLYDGVIIQEMLDTFYAVVFPVKNKTYNIKIDEFYSHKIIDAKFKNNILMAVGIKDEKYKKFIIRFNSDYTKYDIRDAEIELLGINFDVIDSGICVHFTEKGLEVFSNIMDENDIRLLNDPSVNRMTLYSNGINILGSLNNNIYKITMKN